MKRLITIATATAVAAPMAVLAQDEAQDAGPQVYGRVHGALNAAAYDESDDAPNDAEPTFTTNSSAIGIRGKEPLNPGLTALYQWEAGVYWSQGKSDSDGGSNITNQQRDSYLGLEGRYGKLLAGRLPFGNQFAHQTNAFTHQMGTSAGYVMHEIGSRADDTLWYSAPVAQDLKVNVTYLGEGNNLDDNGEPVGNAYGAQVHYDSDRFLASATWFQDDLIGRQDPLWSLAGKWDYGMGELGAQLSQQDEATVTNLMATYRIATGKLKAQITSASDYAANFDNGGPEDPVMYVLGYDHTLSERTTAYVVAAMGKDGASITDNGFGTGSEYNDAGDLTESDDSQGLSVGMVHNF